MSTREKLIEQLSALYSGKINFLYNANMTITIEGKIFQIKHDSIPYTMTSLDVERLAYNLVSQYGVTEALHEDVTVIIEASENGKISPLFSTTVHNIMNSTNIREGFTNMLNAINILNKKRQGTAAKHGFTYRLIVRGIDTDA